MSKPKKKKSAAQVQQAPIKQSDAWVALSVVIVTFIVFSPALRNEFVAWDDYQLLVQNPHYRGLWWTQLRWMFTTFHMGHYQPLSWITFALDYLVWGMNPLGYHLTNLILHAANAVLFYFLTLRLLSLALPTRSASEDLDLKAAAGFAALFFAIHPLRVESVAWATERRDVLSGLFFLATILWYLPAAKAALTTRDRRRRLGAALICYALSLLSKASGVTLPVVLLVLDVYPLKRLGPGKWFTPSARPIWWEKIPFLLFAAGAAAIAPLAQQDVGAMKSVHEHGIVPRVAQSLYGLAFYLWKTIWPTNLSGLYELPPNLNPFAWPFLLSAVTVVAVSIVMFILRRRWPAGLASWICYVIILFPVLGIVQSGWQMVADRYSYLSCLAWAILAGGGLYYYLRKNSGAQRRGWKPFPLAAGVSAGIIIALSVLSWRQVQVWHDTDGLWNHILAITDNSTFRSGNVYHLLARFEVSRGNLDRAIEHFRKSVEIEPDYPPFYNDLGNALARRGRLDEAIENYRRALALNPRLSLVQFNLGSALALQGHLREAEQYLEEALRIKPDYAEAYNNLGKVLAAEGYIDKAIYLFRQAVQIKPDFAEAHQSLAMALAEKGMKEEAAWELQEALRITQSQSQIQAGQ